MPGWPCSIASSTIAAVPTVTRRLRLRFSESPNRPPPSCSSPKATTGTGITNRRGTSPRQLRRAQRGPLVAAVPPALRQRHDRQAGDQVERDHQDHDHAGRTDPPKPRHPRGPVASRANALSTAPANEPDGQRSPLCALLFLSVLPGTVIRTPTRRNGTVKIMHAHPIRRIAAGHDLRPTSGTPPAPTSSSAPGRPVRLLVGRGGRLSPGPISSCGLCRPTVSRRGR